MNFKNRLTMFVDSKGFGIFVFLLIFYSVVCFSLETIPDISDSSLVFFHYSEIVVVILFTIEYLIRIHISGKKLGYILSFYGIIDLLAIIPFYLTFAIDLRSIRLFRMFRLFRIFKLARYNKALIRFSKALKDSKEELIIFSVACLVLLYISAVGIYYFEHSVQPDAFRSIIDCLWWAVSTLTTVGYGDVYPITIGGKLFTFFILIIGLGMIAVPAGILSSSLTKIDKAENTEDSSI